MLPDRDYCCGAAYCDDQACNTHGEKDADDNLLYWEKRRRVMSMSKASNTRWNTRNNRLGLSAKVLQGFLAGPMALLVPQELVKQAVEVADLLIAEVDRTTPSNAEPVDPEAVLPKED